MSKEDRDDAVEIVGRRLYGEMWIGELKKEEWESTRRVFDLRQPVDLPADPKEAAKIANARLRSVTTEIQNAQVFRWLAQQGVNCVGSTFDRAEFDVWFRKAFGEHVGSSTDKRKAAVREMLQSGLRPGRGGTTWKEFKAQSKERTGLDFDVKTLRRDVADLLPSLTGLDISDISKPE